MSKHTPDEWRPLDIRYPEHFPKAAERYWRCSGEWMQRASDLAHALRALAHSDDDPCWCLPPRTTQEHTVGCEWARAALAKAEGREP
jgi:hypothetical protein